MPAVVPAIGSFFTAVSTFAASSAVAGFLVNTVSSIALSALATAIAGKPDVRQPGITTQTTTAGGTIPQRLIFGRYATAGQMVAPMMVYQTDGNPNEWLVYVISLADKPVTGLARIFVDGVAYEIDGNPAAGQHADAMGATVLDTPQESLRNKVYIRFHSGNQTAADAYLRRVFGDYPERPWTADMIGHGVAYAVVTFKGKAQDGDYSGFPSIKFEVDGHPLWDPRTGTQAFTRNPAVIAWNILRGIDIPGGDRWGVGATDYVMSHVIAAANLCDEQVPVDGGGTRTRYQAGLEVSVSDEPHKALMEFVKAMGGDVADMGGTWLLSAGEPSGPVLSITDDDIIVTDSRSLKPYPGLDETVNAIHASYPDPEQQWEAKEAVPLYNAAYEAKDGGRRLIAEVDFPAAPYPQQVRALMREMLADHRRMRTHVITLPPDALGVKLGEHIAWSSAINGYQAKLFKVAAIRIDPVSLCVALTITERDPSDYDYDAASDGRVPTVRSAQPVSPVIAGITGWSVTAVNAGGRPGIRMSWDPEVNARALSWVIRLASDGSEANSGTSSDVTRGENVQTAGLRPSTSYLVTGKLVIPGRGTESVTVPVTTLDIGILRDDLDAELRDLLDDAQQFIGETPGLLDEIRGEAEAARQLAIDNLLVAQNYTDTSVNTETVARQTDVGQLSARINEITAANTSSNLLTNPDFADGTTGWAGVTVSGGKATVLAAGAQQTFDATFGIGELFQWRVEHNGPSGHMRIRPLDAAGATIGNGFVTVLPASTTAKVASGQHTPPEGTAKIRLSVTGEGLVIDNIAATKIDQQTIARIQALEVALAGDQQALASFQTSANTRFQNIEAGVQSNADALLGVYTKSAADQATAGQIASYNTGIQNQLGGKASASSVNALTNRVTATEQGLSAQGDSITSLNADVGRFKANGLFRVSVAATPTGAESRIALSAAASSGAATSTAAMYLDAIAGGTSRAVVWADRFAIVSGPADTPKFPFVVDGGSIRMDADVWIKNLSIGPDKVAVDGMSNLWNASFGEMASPGSNQWAEVGRLTFTPYAANTKLLVTGQAKMTVSSPSTGQAMTGRMRVLINGTQAFYRENGGWIGIVGMRRSVAGTNTIVVQMAQESSWPSGGYVNLSDTSIYVAEFKR